MCKILPSKMVMCMFLACSYVDPQAVVGCGDGKVRVFDMYSKKISQLIKYVFSLSFQHFINFHFFLKDSFAWHVSFPSECAVVHTLVLFVIFHIACAWQCLSLHLFFDKHWLYSKHQIIYVNTSEFLKSPQRLVMPFLNTIFKITVAKWLHLL